MPQEMSVMFAQERRELIAQIIETEGRATVEDLAQRFGVSVDSIRKDLKRLVDAGVCKRAYGGATRLDRQVPTSLTPPHAPETYTAAETEASRRYVAQLAFAEIADQDAIFLDISVTSLYIAELLAQSTKRVIVTTNMVEVPHVLAANPAITTLATGGYLTSDRRGYTGPNTVGLLEQLVFKKAFISAASVDLGKKAAMTELIDDGVVKMQARANGTTTYLMAEKFKFSRSAGYRFASLKDFDVVLTDARDQELISELEALGIKTLN